MWGNEEPGPRAQIKAAHSGKPKPDTLQILRPSTVEPNVTLGVGCGAAQKRWERHSREENISEWPERLLVHNRQRLMSCEIFTSVLGRGDSDHKIRFKLEVHAVPRPGKTEHIHPVMPGGVEALISAACTHRCHRSLVKRCVSRRHYSRQARAQGSFLSRKSQSPPALQAK